MTVVEEVEAALQKLNPEVLQVIDESDGCGAKINILIVSTVFAGKSTLASHREVQQNLGGLIDRIHAITIKALTPEKYAARQNA